MAEKLRSFYINYVSHQQNAHANALASLADSLALLVRVTEKALVHNCVMYCPKFALEDSQTQEGDFQVKENPETSTIIELRDWQFSFIDYILYDIFPNDCKELPTVIRKAPRFYYNAIMQTLHHLSHNGILLCCLSHKEAHEALREVHDGMCGTHQPGPKIKDRL